MFLHKAPLSSAAIIVVAAVACAHAQVPFSPHIQKNGIVDPNHQGISPPRIVTNPDDVVVDFTAGWYFVHSPKTGGETLTMMVEKGELSPLVPCFTPLHNTLCHTPATTKYNQCRVHLPMSNVVGCMASAEGNPASLNPSGSADRLLIVDPGVKLLTLVREPMFYHISAYAHGVARYARDVLRNRTRSDSPPSWKGYIRQMERKDELEKHEPRASAAWQLDGLQRMTWIGVTEFYHQSICALRSIIHEKPMCSCAVQALHQTSTHQTHGTQPDNVALTGDDLKRLKSLHSWRVESLKYSFAVTHLNATLAKFGLLCLLELP